MIYLYSINLGLWEFCVWLPIQALLQTVDVNLNVPVYHHGDV